MPDKLQEWAKSYMAKRKERMTVTESGCWIPDLRLTNLGYCNAYCRLGFPNRNGGLSMQPYLHRLSYWFHHETFDPALEIAHICHNPACFNPDHLRACSRQANVDDQVNGGSAPGRKIGPEQRKYIREAFMKGVSRKDIAATLQVNVMTVMRHLWAMGLAGGKKLKGKRAVPYSRRPADVKRIEELERQVEELEEALARAVLD